MRCWEFSTWHRGGRTLVAVQRVTRDAVGAAVGRGSSAALEWEPRDVWVGVYWRRSRGRGVLDVYVCVLPCLPIHLCLWNGS